METGSLVETAEVNPELRNRCQPWKVDDPLSNYLKGVPSLVSLRSGAFVSNRTTNLFDELRDQDGEKLYSFFKLNRGILPQIWRDMLPTSGTTWVSGGELQVGVERYRGLPLDGEAVRVMDIHNHPLGYPEAPSADDTSFFLTDLDIQIQVVVSDKGTHILAKPQAYNSNDFDQNEYESVFREMNDTNLGNPAQRDKEFTKWVANRYGLKSFWVRRGTNLIVPYR